MIAAEVRLYREGLANLLCCDGRVEVVGTSRDRAGALERIGALAPDVVIVDATLGSSVDTVRALLSARPGVRIVAIAVPDREAEVLSCAEAGVSGYVTLDASTSELVEAVERAARGELICSPQMTATLFRRVATLAAANAPRPPVERLTARELEIVELIEDGRTNKQIAQQLHIEVPTVKNHVHHILDKLNISRRDDVRPRLRAGAQA